MSRSSGEFNDAEAFSRHLADRIVPLQPLLREHIDDNFGSLLPHVFMGEVARWYLSHADAVQPPSDVRLLIDLLDEALVTGAPDVSELVSVSFVENMPAPPNGRGALAHLGPALKADYQRWTGVQL